MLLKNVVFDTLMVDFSDPYVKHIFRGVLTTEVDSFETLNKKFELANIRHSGALYFAAGFANAYTKGKNGALPELNAEPYVSNNMARLSFLKEMASAYVAHLFLDEVHGRYPNYWDFWDGVDDMRGYVTETWGEWFPDN